MKNFFSVIIITLNEEKNIKILLNSLKRQKYKNFEVIIADSNSQDKTEFEAKKFFSSFKEFRFIKMQKRGISLGRNTGAKNAKYENLLFLDADTILNSDFLEKLNKYINSKKNIGGGTFWLSLKSKKINYSIGNFLINFGNTAINPICPTCIGACLFAKKKVFNEVGGFNENMSLGEDSNFSFKIHRKGYKFRIIPITFHFSPRRFEKEGTFKTIFKYLKSGVYLMMRKDVNNEEFDYKFGHYK